MPYSRRACIFDGVTDPTELEFHAVGGVTVAICRRCYRGLLANARNRPARIWEPPDELERIGHALIGEADLLAELAQQRHRFGRMLIERVRRDIPIDTDGDSHSSTEK